MTLNPVCENVETAQGVPLTVTGVAQVKIMKNADLLQTASEQFLGKKEHEIKSTVLQTLEGHLRAILGKFIEKPYKFLADVAKALIFWSLFRSQKNLFCLLKIHKFVLIFTLFSAFVFILTCALLLGLLSC